MTDPRRPAPRRSGPPPGRAPAIDPRAEPGSTGEGRIERVSTQFERVREPEHPTLVMDRVRETETPTLELEAPPIGSDNPTIEMPIPEGAAKPNRTAGTLVMERGAAQPARAGGAPEAPSPLSGFRVQRHATEPPPLATGPHDLGSDETLVLLSFDDNLSLEEMSGATGLPAQRVHQIVRKLRRLGVLEAPPPLDDPTPDSITSPHLDPQPASAPEPAGDEDLYPPTWVDEDAAVLVDRPTKGSDLDAPTFVDMPAPSSVRGDEADDDDDDVRTGKRADAGAVDGAVGDDDDDDDDDGGATRRRERQRVKYRAPLRREEEPLVTGAQASGQGDDVDPEADTDAGDTDSKDDETDAAPDAKTGGPPDAKTGAPIRGSKQNLPSKPTESTPPAAKEDDEPAEDELAPTSEREQDDDERTHVDDGAVKKDEDDEVGPEGINYRKIYETELHPLPLDERIELAGKASGNTLMALCYDANARVIRTLMDNTAANVEHARLAAFHHRTAMGLEALATRGEYMRDPQVVRRLTRNPMLPEPVLRRLLMARRLVEVYKFTCDHDVPERSRTASRGILRRRFATAQPEERVELIWKTEGRALIGLTGATFDSKTTAMLCARTYVSVMLVQSLARFPATPPTLIAHLLKQPMVKRQVHLKNLLIRHPNTPGDVKRRM